MSSVDIGTIVFVIITIVYAVFFDRFLRPKKVSFYRGMLLATPGLLVILVLYAWLALGFSLQEIAIFALLSIVIIPLKAFLIKTNADWLSKFPSVQRWAKGFLEKRIVSQRKRGYSAKELQKQGQIPDNEKLRKNGFSDEELRELGLLD
ncbi:MAG: hypothetical protein HY776_07765 [Actinobacteria bacterium]|nr:hypothetical protein [Actinomycetota bacterium]